MEDRVRVDQVERASLFRFPLSRTLLTGTSQAAAQSLGVVPSNNLGLIKRLIVSNQMAVSVTLTLYAIPNGGTIGAANREITGLSVAGNTNVDLSELITGLYGEGTEFKAFASVASALYVGGFMESLL